MVTKQYKTEIEKCIKDQTYTATYTFFSDYEDINGQPKNSIIFLSYKKFDEVIIYFFEQLVEFLKNTGNYENLKDEEYFSLCVEESFIYTAISSGNLSNKIKNKFNNLKLTNETEFENLIVNIKNIKFYFRDKYITLLFKKIRDQLGAKLQKENEIFLCPYCQRNYVNVVEKDLLTIKPDLDHFYPKAKYPFLAATLENLVPSCQVCNSRLKKEIDFYKIKHSHPLQLSEKFFHKLSFNYLNDKTIYIENKNILELEEQKCLETFKIEEVYNSNTEILDEILEKSKKYNMVKKFHLAKTCPSLSEKIIKDIVFYEYFHINDKKVPMSTMKKSLFKKIVK